MSAEPIGDPDGATPHVVVEAVDPLVASDATLHHLGRVRRLRPDDRCSATDGAGRWRWCRWTGDRLEPDGPVVSVDRPDPPITIAVALTKGDKPELVVQKLTELGVDRIAFFRAARSVVRWDEAKAESHRARWSEIARSALGQCHGAWLPAIDPVGDLATVAALGAVRLDRTGRPPSAGDTVVAIGPEGGWTQGERAQLPDAVSLGPRVLRAETAALTAGGVLTSLRAGIVEITTSSGRAR